MRPIIIAGGGTVGLATAVFLGHYGVPTHVIERRAQLSDHPRALGISPRTLEIFRGVGLSDAIDAVAVRSAVPGRATARTVADIDPTRLPKRPPFLQSDVSPEVPLGHYSQDRIDSVLLPAARSRGAVVEFGVGVESVVQDDVTVTTILSDGRRIETDFLIAADGVNSTVRTVLGIGTTGPGPIGEPTLNILFEADLTAVGQVPMMTEITHPDASGMLLAVGDNRWVLHTKPLADQQVSNGNYTRVVRTAIGADVAIRIVNALPWRANLRLADQFRRGRVFLVGDAARTISPLGAFGLNTGIADAHNLAWKLALVALGAGGDHLLDSYHTERHAVAEMVTHQATVRWTHQRLHWDPTAVAGRAAVGAWNAPLVTIGYRYDSDAIVGPVEPLPSTEDLAVSLDSSPGSRLPHHWMGDVSTLDLVGPGFTLWTADDHWNHHALEASVPVISVDDAAVAEALRIDGGQALLVRPDGFIAWRAGRSDATHLAEVIDSVTARARKPIHA